jgi:DNA-binding transcriptional MerR regulator
MSEFVEFETIAEMAGVSIRTIRSWIESEGITVYTLGDRRKRYVKRDDAEYLAAPRILHRNTASTPAQVGI